MPANPHLPDRPDSEQRFHPTPLGMSRWSAVPSCSPMVPGAGAAADRGRRPGLARLGRRPAAGLIRDLAIFSFYKAVGVPEGALLSSRPVNAAVHGRAGTTVKLVRQLASRHQAWLTSRSSMAARLRPGSTHKWRSSAWSFDLGKIHAPPSRVIAFLLPRLLEPDPAERRRRHYQILLDELAGQVPAALTVLPDGAAPYFFPIQTTDKPGLLALLDEREIDAVDFWRVAHPSLSATAFPMAAQLRASIVGAPVHQELRRRDLERIVTVVRQWGGRARTQQPRTRAAPHRV